MMKNQLFLFTRWSQFKLLGQRRKFNTSITLSLIQALVKRLLINLFPIIYRLFRCPKSLLPRNYPLTKECDDFGLEIVEFCGYFYHSKSSYYLKCKSKHYSVVTHAHIMCLFLTDVTPFSIPSISMLCLRKFSNSKCSSLKSKDAVQQKNLLSNMW